MISIANLISETLPESLQNLAVIRILTFFVLVIISLLLGKIAPRLLRNGMYKISPDKGDEIYSDLIEPVEPTLKVSVRLIFLSWSLVWLKSYEELYEFSRPLFDLGVTVSLGWLISRLIHQLLAFYGLSLIQRLRLADEVLLAVEMAINIMIGILAVLTFAQMRGLNLVTAVAGLGLIGGGLTLAAQRIVEQLLSTIVLYLDRPFIPGDYIRMDNGELGKVEAIGFRSTRVRALGKNTLFIFPNSALVNHEVENVSRGKKVVVMLQLDFNKKLLAHEQALVVRETKTSTESLLGIDAANTNVAIEERSDGNSRARLVFFILGAHENSLEFRKRLLSVANERIADVLTSHNLTFTTQEPTVYIDAPMTI